MVVDDIKNNSSSEFRNVIEEAFSILGEPSKKALIYHLQDHYAIDLSTFNDSIPVEKLEHALKDLLGEAGLLLMEHVQTQLQKIHSPP